MEDVNRAQSTSQEPLSERVTMDLPSGLSLDNPATLFSIAVESFRRYELMGKRDDLEAAISIAEMAVSATPEDHPCWVMTLGNLGGMLFRRYELTENMDDSKAAITVAEMAVSAASEGHPDRARMLNNLGGMLFRRYERTKNMDDLDEAIKRVEMAVSATPEDNPDPEDHPDRVGMLKSLGSMLVTRYERKQNMSDLKAAIEIAEKAVYATTEDHPDRAGILHNLGATLFRRYERTKKMDDLEAAIDRTEMAVSATPEDDPDRTGSLNNLRSMLISLQNVLFNQYERWNKVDDLKAAISTAEKAVSATPNGHPDRAEVISYLGSMLFCLYERIGDPNDLEEAISNVDMAVSMTSEDHPDWPGRLNDLGSMLLSRYKLRGNINDLNAAISTSEMVLSATPEDHPNRAGWLSNFGNRLFHLYERNAQIDDLQAAISRVEKAVSTTPDDHRDMVVMLNTLGITLFRLYERMGKMDDLEAAIDITEKAGSAMPEDHPLRAHWLENSGNMLFYRYQRIGDMNNLETAILRAKMAVSTTPKDYPDRAGMLNSLGGMLLSRYERTQDMDDLEAAISKQEMAVSATSEDHYRAWAMFLNNLGNMLFRRHERTKDEDDLESAIKSTEKALSATPKDHPDRAGWLSNLGNELLSRYELTKNMEDLKAAIKSTEEALSATPKDHPLQTVMLNHLGIMRICQYERAQNKGDQDTALDAALDCFQASFECINSIPVERVKAARHAIRILQWRNEWKRAASIAQRAVELIPLVCSRYLSREDQQHAILQTSGLAAQSCSLSLKIGQVDKALQQLEFGRGLILGYLIDSRSDLSELRKDCPDLADTYDTLRFKASRVINTGDPVIQEQMIKERMGAARDLEGCLRQIRQQPGHERFLLEPTTDELKSAATEGPIVIVNATDIGIDAIIVSTSDIRAIALPKMTASKAQERGLGCPKVLEWLWDAVASPIMDALGFTQPPSDDNWPHMWWIPTGYLSQFPLHAAGHHSRRSSETVLDRVMSSYSSSIKAIIHGRPRRDPEVTPSAPARALLVAMEQTPGHPSLRFATNEVMMLRGLCKSITVNPIEPRRRKQDIMLHMPNCKIFHFAGHGYTDNLDPSQSSLLLQDWESDRLTVATLLEMNLRERSPFLAYLSACGTGQIKHKKFVDESIHLISAYQLAGFRHVIGTLWEVNDNLCVDMARITYETMRDGGMTDESVCQGLHNATLQLRDRWLSMPAKDRRGRRSVKKGDTFLADDETGFRSASDRDQRADRLPRKAEVIYESDDEPTPPWVPYVHFGV